MQQFTDPTGESNFLVIDCGPTKHSYTYAPLVPEPTGTKKLGDKWSFPEGYLPEDVRTRSQRRLLEGKSGTREGLDRPDTGGDRPGEGQQTPESLDRPATAGSDRLENGLDRPEEGGDRPEGDDPDQGRSDEGRDAVAEGEENRPPTVDDVNPGPPDNNNTSDVTNKHWGRGGLETSDYMLGTFRAHVHLSHNVTGG